MRIVAGEFGGRRLTIPRDDRVRPTADRVREAWMSIVAPELPGARVLDLFAGSGALGLEALSRGARHAVFCETDARAVRALRMNVHALGYGERCEIDPRDARRRMADDRTRGRRYHLLFLDPPYTMLHLVQGANVLHLADLLVPGGLAVVESSAADPPPDVGLELDTTRRFGEARIGIYRRG
jgi:16S rRNA (guanine966-N2)-methyltransferase